MAIQVNGVDSPVTQAWADLNHVSGQHTVAPCFTIDPRFDGHYVYMGLNWANKPVIAAFGEHAATFHLHPQAAPPDHPQPSTGSIRNPMDPGKTINTPVDPAAAPANGFGGHTQIELIAAIQEIEGLLSVGVPLEGTTSAWPSGLTPHVTDGKVTHWTTRL